VRHKVIVIGGGVAGMSAAHELAVSGDFDVVVYELRSIPGGKARSMPAKPGTGGRGPLPGEHGFRFFPGFYRHITHTMSRIPYPGQAGGVLDNLVTATEIQLAQEDGRNELVTPAHFPVSTSDWRATLRFATEYAVHLGIPVVEQVHFVSLLSDLLSACEERRFEQYENQSWWAFSGAERRSEGYRTFLADGLTRSLVAARAKEMSARTGGYILLQLLQDLAKPRGQVDRVLKGPTNEMWIDPWLRELERLGVDYRLSHKVEAIRSSGERVTGISGHEQTPAGEPGQAFEDEADYYIAAVPVEVLREEIAMRGLTQASPALAALGALTVRWMNGIMFYLKQDVPLIHGHSIYIDSPWALTSISQRQFWPSVNLRGLGDGSVGGLLSVDISDWCTPGEHAARGKAARRCTRDEVAAEVWAQLKAALNNRGEVLSDSNLADWFLDPAIVHPNPTEAMNLEPLLINTAGSWARRPEPGLPEIENLFLASDYVRTFTDLATMEGANEAARRAVNAILDASGSDSERCDVWPLSEPGGLLFQAARTADRVIFKLFGPRRGPPPTVTLTDGDLETNPITRAAHRQRLP
jgi:uncharacterized protein with NAD-binding domain and iron-sulfur cluster